MLLLLLFTAALGPTFDNVTYEGQKSCHVENIQTQS